MVPVVNRKGKFVHNFRLKTGPEAHLSDERVKPIESIHVFNVKFLEINKRSHDKQTVSLLWTVQSLRWRNLQHLILNLLATRHTSLERR